jgi:hypothetical protein
VIERDGLGFVQRSAIGLEIHYKDRLLG